MDLMTKTFLIIGGMLIITTIAARFNKALETKTEATIAIGGSFLTLFICFILADQYPINLWACAAFSGFTGWILGPAVGNIGYAIKFGKFAESKGVKVKEVLVDFNITDKVKFAVRDNAQNMVSAFLGSGIKEIGCLSHSLQLCIKNEIFL